MFKIEKNKKIVAMLLAVGLSLVGRNAYAVDSTKDVQNDKESNASIQTEDDSKLKDDSSYDKKHEAAVEKDTTSKNNEVHNNSTTDANNNKVNNTNKNDLNNLKSNKSKWMTVDGKLYYVTKDGIVKQVGWFKEKSVNPDSTNENDYYIDKDFAAVVGWKQIDEKWYYFDEKGVKTTGWQNDNGKLYYLDDQGVMQKGWIESKTNKYYLDDNGVLSIGKKMIGDAWYVFDEKGALKTGFFNYKGKTYYSHENGVLGENEYVETNGNKYYVKCDGTIATGSLVIDGKLEEFNNEGKYVGTKALSDYLYVKYLNVGNADCAFIKLPNGETALIDTGDRSTRDSVVDFLKTQNLKNNTIDYVVITHAHSDHIGGLASVLKNFNVKKVYMPKVATMKPWYLDLQESVNVTKDDINMVKRDYAIFQEAERAMKEKNLEFTNTVFGQYIDSQKILQFVESDMDFSKDKQNGLDEYWDLNNNSALVYLNYDSFKGLFAGDLCWKAESQIYHNDWFKGRKVDVLKAGHHGLQSASTEPFIKYVNPDICVISRDAKSVAKNDAINNMINNESKCFETSKGEKGGFSVYATKDNWNGQY